VSLALVLFLCAVFFGGPAMVAYYAHRWSEDARMEITAALWLLTLAFAFSALGAGCADAEHRRKNATVTTTTTEP
jgi:hypothetical protein